MIRQNTVAAIAANLSAMSFITGFALYFTLLMDARYPRVDLDPMPQLQFLIENEALLHGWYLVIYVFFGVCLVVLCLALHQRLQSKAPLLTRVATSYGLVWVVLVIASGLVATIGNNLSIAVYARDPDQSAILWLLVQTICNALGGGNEIVGGLWICLISLAGLHTAGLPHFLSLPGLLVGLAGILTLVPSLEPFAAVFGFGCIFWFGGLSALFFSETKASK